MFGENLLYLFMLGVKLCGKSDGLRGPQQNKNIHTYLREIYDIKKGMY